ncbi:TetR family transcriptional regulator [Oceanobacillus sp. CFH 90083]|uniref:TetR family transcriptional regulator n=1 Tax=Oceanobacillus sp. CFH 90083 TaxID=2592336 RepID=UPI00128E004B|nr:TetR family transcriptional regulator [Oceanobacillus sp. CFH 90083]
MAPKVSEAYKKEKKKELIKAAKQVFIKKGYVHASMQDIMDEAGISRGAFYSYFDNIDHVFIEVLKYDDEQDIQFFITADEEPLWAGIEDWVKEQHSVIEAVNQSLLYAKAEFFLSSQYVKNKENFPYISQRYEQMVEAIAQVIRKGMEQGEFQPHLSPNAIARYLISFVNGLMLDTFQLGHEKTEVKNQLNVLLFTLEKMLRPGL